MTDPLSLLEVERKIADISDRLTELVDEHEQASAALAAAEAAYERTYHSTRARLYLDNPKQKVDMVESLSRVSAVDQYDALIVARQREAFVRHAMRSLQSVLSAYQTTSKGLADEAGHGRYGRR